VPPGSRPFYCFASVGLNRSADEGLPLGFDLCAGAQGHLMLASRDSGQADLQPLTVRGVTILSFAVPIYRGGSTPATTAARRAAFVGWVGMSIVPDVILTTALQGHPDTSVALRFVGGASATAFRYGAAPVGGQAVTVRLDDGWNVEVSGPSASVGPFGNADALLILCAGTALSLLLGAVIYLLGAGRARAMAQVLERTEQLAFQALHDSLTGLPNRALILDRIEQMLVRGRRNHHRVAAMFLDLDDFKDINDTLGHHVGDQLLIDVAQRLTTALRESDTVGRLGGDEFVLLVEGDLKGRSVEAVAERVLEILRPPFQIPGQLVPLSVSGSIGIAIGDRATPGELLRDADIALYRAKAAGKARVVVFAASMHAADLVHRQFEADLHGALAADQFFLLYQPTIDLKTNAIAGVEALLRWNHPTRGIVQPNDFIPALESTGLIVAVGAWVLEEACRQGAIWQEAGHRCTVSANVSAKQFERYRILDDVARAISSSGFDPALLILELTESTLMNDVEETIARLALLKSLGVRLAIDDFGTGYSSLAYLRRFPVDVLKIDRSFVSAIAESVESAALVHTLVELGKALDLETIAEGIETDDQRMRLIAESVDIGQGFLFSKPVDAASVDRLLARPVVVARR
jgi:diguanylate cyclase (GGDEF)-like protein